MPPRREGLLAQVVAAAGTALLLAAAGIFLLRPGATTNPGMVRSSYDALYHFSPEPQFSLRNAPVVLVYLDRESYVREGQNPDEPWDRRLHAVLVRRLTGDGARAVVFDVVFDGPGRDPVADQELAEAIRVNGRVILAAELNDWQRQTGVGLDLGTVSPVLPFEPLKAAAAGWGLASLRVDDDFTVRRFFPGFERAGLPSLTTAALRLPGLSGNHREESENLWLRYAGPPLALPHVSFSAALRREEVPAEFFRDRIVLIGARPRVSSFTERRDEYRNPWPDAGRGSAFMPAVEVHASQMLNQVRAEALHRIPVGGEIVMVLGLALSLPALLFCFRPLPAAALALALEGALVLAVAAAFRGSGWWFPWLIVAWVQIPGALAGSVLFRSVEWYRQRRRLEAARRVAEAQIREQAALLDKAQDAILVRDLAGRVTYVNPAAERLSGWTRAEWLGGDVAGLVFAAAAGQQPAADEACAARGEWLGELEWVHRDGGRRIVQSRWTLLRDPAGNPSACLLINTDITEKKRLEAEFLRAQRLESMGALAGGMAHDLNSALAPVLMGIQLLRRDTADPEARRMLTVMEENTCRGADMVRQVLLFSRGASDERTVVQPGAVLSEMERIVRHSFPRNIPVHRLAPADVWPVLANPTQLYQVLLNLCVNARDAMPNGGELTLAADNVVLTAPDAALIPHGRPGEFVLWLVSDTGEGIAPENLPRLFEPFFTTKPTGKGTGLGLSTVARIVTGHGGFVRVQSEPGQGTLFEVYLPRAVGRATEAGPVPLGQSPRGQGERVLVIEDDQAVAELLLQSLRDQGYEPLHAASLPAGKTMAGAHAGRLSVVLLDAALMTDAGGAGGLRGTELFPGAAVLLMTPEDSPVGATPDDVIQKPFGLPVLFERLAAAIQRKRAEPEPGGGQPPMDTNGHE